jgi:hypothetical protein
MYDALGYITFYIAYSHLLSSPWILSGAAAAIEEYIRKTSLILSSLLLCRLYTIQGFADVYPLSPAHVYREGEDI